MKTSTRPTSWRGPPSPGTVAAAVAAALGVMCAPLALAQNASGDDLQSLKEQLREMQRKIERLEAQQAQQALQGQQAQQAQQTAPAQQATPPQPAAPSAPSQAGAGSSAPSFYVGPIKVTPGGFIELMVVNRDHNESADWASNYNTGIPFPNSHNFYLSEFHLTERQSRVQSLFQGPDNEDWTTEAYVEADFGGAGGTANNNESSSFSPRVRHYFADLTYKSLGATLLFGQTWSLITGFRQGLTARQENIPLTIDGQYVPGFDWLRLPQLRFTEKFNDLFSGAVSFENPAAQISSNASAGAPALPVMFNNPGATNSFTPTNGATPGANNISVDYLPDIVAKVGVDPGYGHFEAFVTERFFRDRITTKGLQVNEKTNATGFGGNMILPLVPKILDFQASVLTGRGVGRYGSAQLPDATINAGHLSVDPIRGFQVLAGLILRPSPAWTFFGYIGEEEVDRDASFRITDGKTYGYGYGNAMFDNSGCLVEGGTACAANTSRIVSGTLGGWWKFYQGWLGNGQLGITDTWIRREIFSGIGGDPSTNINITMVSFRYYPFQK